jgi:hypothetical protein
MPITTPEQSYIFELYLEFQKSLCSNNFDTAAYALDTLQDFLTIKKQEYERNQK